ncbi:MAG TPA: hypothetical protein VFH95_05620 [Candidatus Kapabacteria bacterium]|nr:hypothetical protein [Candidatus Kapabacteria bacterium]
MALTRFGWLPILAILGSCAPKPADNSTAMAQISADSLKPVSKVLSEHTDTWMNIPGVTGTGETKKDGKPAILILVDSNTDSLRSELPSTVEGYPVIIQETGEIRPLPAK